MTTRQDSRCDERHDTTGPRGPRALVWADDSSRLSTRPRSWPSTTPSTDLARGALLRREGLYSSLIVNWRRQRDRGGTTALARPPGRQKADPRDREIARLKREIERLAGELDKSRTGRRDPGKTFRAVGATRHGQHSGERRTEMIDDAIDRAGPDRRARHAALSAVGVDRATWYRRHRKSPAPPRPERIATPQPRALSPVERKQIKALLESDEFVDEAPATVYAKLLDQGTYLGSVSTMYRILREHDEVRERRRQATHPAHKKPELIATRPERGLELGHHQAARPGEVDLLLPLRDLGHLQPLRRGLDAGPGRAGRSSRSD